MEVNRPTFTQVREAQTRLKFDFIEKLIETNETVGVDSRKAFFDIIAVSLLGFELKYDFNIEYDNGTCNMGNLSDWLGKFIDFKDTPTQEIMIHGKKTLIKNSVLWRNLLDNLYKPMSEAKQLALKTSAEVMSREGGAYDFRADRKIKQE